jgi:hypothetical protein
MVSVWMRRSGRHALEPAMPKPDYQIRNFHELRDVLVRDFGVNLTSQALDSIGDPGRPSKTKAGKPGDDTAVADAT